MGDWIQTGLLITAGGALMWSVIHGKRRLRLSQQKDAVKDFQEELRAIEGSAQGLVQQMEVRLHDEMRAVEGRIDNRLTVLDQLILDADREIQRLTVLLTESRRATLIDRELTAEETQRVLDLAEVGFDGKSIARSLGIAEPRVTEVLRQWEPPEQQAA
ncbi:hypothetical protein [Planctellipticum variicoloris]|uniref:hypothetical protein n=1 Tax=Planctellipticum variicoloris TaxID=3064265 RepID=UPI002C8EF6CD|nr:hypothetical protein SH412_003029 [Planctomycetaceae bacterium SH412]HTN04404.1 hypothetical protein [Planctomycetaceae bacterium]